MLADGVTVFCKSINSILPENPVPASRMNQVTSTESEAGGAEDEGLGRSPSPDESPVADDSDEGVNKNKNHVTALTSADNERPWVCGQCHKSFGSARALKIHEVKQHESASRHFLKCGNCDEVFEHTNLLQIHMRVHHNVRVRCLRCKDMFDNPAMLRVHFKENHSDPICLACGLKFDHDKLLRLHMEHYHKVGGKATKKDMMAFCEELSVKMAYPEGGDVTTNSSPNPEGQISPRTHCGSLTPECVSTEESAAEAEWDTEQSNGSLRTRQSPSDCNVGMKAPVADAVADVEVEVEKNDVSESRNRPESQGTPEDRRSPVRSPALPTSELSREPDEVKSTQRAFHSYNDKKEESSMPFGNERCEVTSKLQDRTDDVEMASVSVDQRNLQSERPSVITTVSCSERLGSMTNAEKVWDLDNTIVRDKMPPTMHEMRPNSQSPAPKDEPSDDPSSWDDGGLAFEQHKMLARRPSPRCNRCQKWFPSKMEYLHHLISHQDAESQCVKSAEGSSDGDDTSTENNACIDEDKTFGFRGYKRWSVPDIRRPVTGPIGHFSGFNAGKRHSVPDIRPHPVPSDNGSSLNRGLYGTVACSECMSVFFDSRSCKIHIEKRHMKPECRECGLQFDHKNLHKIHMNSYHTANPVLECYVCRQQFKERSEFVSHLTSHETQTVRTDVKSPLTILPANVEASELSGSRRDENLPVRESDSSRHHEDTDEADERHRAQREDHRETRTRIFMPKFRDVRYESRRETAIDRSVSLAFPHHDGEKRSEEHRNVESQPEKYPRVNGLVRTSSLERPPPIGASAGTELPDDRRGVVQVLKPVTEEYKAENNLGGPPPLISVRTSPTIKAETLGDERNSAIEGEPPTFHSPPSRNPAASVAFRPSGPFSPWSHMKGRDGATPEVPKSKHMLDVQPLTKKALLNSLCLRRRASAPELTGLYMPKLVPSAEGRIPIVATNPSVEPEDAEDQNDAKVLDARGNALSSATSFRARQMAMSYQPRRSQPGDFTCQRCGIFFGHKKLLKIHLDSYHGNSRSLQCLHCSQSFDDRAQFLDHVVAHQDGDAILKKGTSNVVQRRKRSAPEVSIRSTATHLESLYNKAITNSKRSRMDDNDQESTRSEEPSSPRSESPRSDEDLPCASRHQVGPLERDEEAANFCFVCGKSFESGKELDQHVSSHAKLDDEGRYCCSLCQKTFDHHRKLESHTRSHTGFKPHKCEYCGRCFPYYSSYYYHKMTHTDHRPHKCEVCGRGFIQARYLRAHLKNHKGGEKTREEGMTVESEESKDSAARTDGLVQIKIELNDHHQQFMAGRIAELEKDAAIRDPERGSCENISSGGNKSGNAKVSESEKWNMRHRVGAAPKSVQTSGETASVHSEDFKSTHRVSLPDTKLDKVEVVTSKGCEPVVVVQPPPNELKATAKPGKRYQCKHCQKRFSSYSSLYVHTRLHTGQRPYACKYCNKRFTHASGMKRHVRCHTGERPYPCTFCTSAFADRGALRSHIRTHTGERPYKCDLCEKTFTQSSSLRVHKKTVHMQHRDL